MGVGKTVAVAGSSLFAGALIFNKPIRDFFAGVLGGANESLVRKVAGDTVADLGGNVLGFVLPEQGVDNDEPVVKILEQIGPKALRAQIEGARPRQAIQAATSGFLEGLTSPFTFWAEAIGLPTPREAILEVPVVGAPIAGTVTPAQAQSRTAAILARARKAGILN